MPSVIATMDEHQLRANINSAHPIVYDYLELASILFETRRFEESVAILRQGLNSQYEPVPRATLLTTLGWYVNGVTRDRVEPRTLAEQAVAITANLESCDAVIARAKANTLLAECAWIDDRAHAEVAAAAGLGLFKRVQTDKCLNDPGASYQVLLELVHLNRLLSHFEIAVKDCQEAVDIAPNENDRVNALIELGTTFRDAGQLNEARDAFKRAITLNAPPFGRVRPYYELGLVEWDLGKVAEGRAKVQKAIDILESDSRLPRAELPEFLRIFGSMSYDLEDFEVAARAFGQAAELYPESDALHWNSLYWLACCQGYLGRYESATTNAILVRESRLASDEDRAKANELLPVEQRLRQSL